MYDSLLESENQGLSNAMSCDNLQPEFIAQHLVFKI